MKRKVLPLLLVACTITLCVLCLSSCALLHPIWSEHTLTIPEDEEDTIYYNDRKYIEYDFGFMYYQPNFEDDWVHIATKPWDPVFYAVLGAITEYYGNDADNPTVITCSRGGRFWFREDITLDYNSTLSIYDYEESFQFSISEITTENKLAYSEDLDKKAKYQKCIRVVFTECPPVSISLDFYMIDGTLYLQTVYMNDYYEVTDEFAAILEQVEHYH